MLCHDTFSTRKWDAFGCKEGAEDVSYFTTGISSALLLSWDQKVGAKNIRERLETSSHTKSTMCIRGPTLKLCVSPSLLLLWVRSSVCLPAPFPGHHRLCVLCSSSCCFWLNFRTWTGKPVWVALWTHLEVLANAQLTLCLKKCRILSKPPSLSMLSCFWLWNYNVLP